MIGVCFGPWIDWIWPIALVINAGLMGWLAARDWTRELDRRRVDG